MYELTLTLDERRAIDWIGDRYATGHEFFLCLQRCDQAPADADWDDSRPITYQIPEHVAWEICGLFDREEGHFPCFSPEFVRKLLEFRQKVA